MEDPLHPETVAPCDFEPGLISCTLNQECRDPCEFFFLHLALATRDPNQEKGGCNVLTLMTNENYPSGRQWGFGH
jgi:hypothetical protein